MPRKPVPDSGTFPVTVDQWLAEMAAGSRKNDEGYTAAEMAERAGMSVEKIRLWLAEANRRGMLATGTRSIRRIDGKRNHVPVYRIVKGGK